jgi:hypothetical protein
LTKRLPNRLVSAVTPTTLHNTPISTPILTLISIPTPLSDTSLSARLIAQEAQEQ